MDALEKSDDDKSERETHSGDASRGRLPEEHSPRSLRVCLDEDSSKRFY